MTKFVKWNDLNQFHEVIKSLGHHRLHEVLVKNDYKIEYGLKIKLHGTNAGVRIDPDGKVTAQKRSSDLVFPNDNAGFRSWVEWNESYFASLARSDATIIVYGEWAGPGIQQGVALSSIPKKHFFVFAMDSYKEDGTFCRLIDGDHIEYVMDRGSALPNDIIVLPWHDKITIDFVNKEEAEKSLRKLNGMTEAVGQEDPFILEMFNTSGCGEGFVCYPFLGSKAGTAYIGSDIEHFGHFNFKAKSEHHRVNKTKTAVAFDPEKFANKNRFADAFCTEQRFQQGFKDALFERKDMKLTPDFIKWVCTDVFKESKTEQAECGLPWADLSKVIAARAAIWYKNKVAAL